MDIDNKNEELFSLSVDEGDADTEVTTKEEFGFDEVVEDTYNLILWNDHVNDMLMVIVALIHVCKLNEKKALETTMEAHNKGRAVAKSGSQKEMLKMKNGLNEFKLEATVELA